MRPRGGCRTYFNTKTRQTKTRKRYFFFLVPKLCLGTHVPKLRFESGRRRETEFRRQAFPNRSLGTRRRRAGKGRPCWRVGLIGIWFWDGLRLLREPLCLDPFLGFLL